MSRCDLHIHSRDSARSEEWLFRRFDFPDSYSQSEQLYAELRASAGWISSPSPITTPSRVACKLRICPNTFISEQVTTYFPQDPCKIHLLVWGITEAPASRYRALRDNIFELQRYLQRAPDRARGRAPALQHQRQARGLASRALILLFKHFEGINGLRDALLSDLAQTIFCADSGKDR